MNKLVVTSNRLTNIFLGVVTCVLGPVADCGPPVISTCLKLTNDDVQL
jgi:hypothetical protein